MADCIILTKQWEEFCCSSLRAAVSFKLSSSPSLKRQITEDHGVGSEVVQSQNLPLPLLPGPLSFVLMRVAFYWYTHKIIVTPFVLSS